MTVDIFKHDNGIVDHQTNGQHHRQQRQGVDRKAQHLHESKRADQRDRDCDQRDDRRPESA